MSTDGPEHCDCTAWRFLCTCRFLYRTPHPSTLYIVYPWSSISVRLHLHSFVKPCFTPHHLCSYKIQDQDQDVKAVYLGEDKDAKYVMEDDGDLEEFVTAALAGNLTPYVKTEPKPKKNKGPVKVVVGSTFDEIVNDASNDVLVEFYAPWCGHCKTLEPIYKKTAKKLKSVAGIVLAKIDATVR